MVFPLHLLSSPSVSDWPAYCLQKQGNELGNEREIQQYVFNEPSPLHYIASNVCVYVCLYVPPSSVFSASFALSNEMICSSIFYCVLHTCDAVYTDGRLNQTKISFSPFLVQYEQCDQVMTILFLSLNTKKCLLYILLKVQNLSLPFCF